MLLFTGLTTRLEQLFRVGNKCCQVLWFNKYTLQTHLVLKYFALFRELILNSLVF